MGGGLMQLVAYGAQDIYLTGNPQITFFKVVYRRHTNFSMEAIEQTWDGSTLTAGRCSSTISRNGDLIYRMYIQLEISDNTYNVANPGAHFIDTVELEIGGQLIDRHSGQWLETWAELTELNPEGRVCALNNKGTLFQRMSGMGGQLSGRTFASDGEKCFVPLQFWFNRNPGLALPLIALQYHEVKVILTHRSVSNANDLSKNLLWADYIYLDTDERRRFAQVSHEYLIEQVQEQTCTNSLNNTINFNHPVKELVWTGLWATGQSARDTVKTGVNWKLSLNGHDRFASRPYDYFTRVQIWQHHSGCGGLDSASSGGTQHADVIAVYSFALKPEEHQPSGTCNFSRIDTAELSSTTLPGAGFVVFAVNYNVLRIMSGMGGLAYSN